MSLSPGSLKGFIFASSLALCLSATVNDQACAKKHKTDYYNNSAIYNQTSMEIFPIRRGYDGAQFIITKEGYWVSIPGLGVSPDATELAAYRDAQNNYWYVDRNNNHIRLTPQEVEWGMAQINQQAQARAMSGQPPIQHDYSASNSMFASGQLQQQQLPVVNVQQPIIQTQQSSSGTGGAIAAGLAAAGGAFAGAALGGMMYNNNYGGIPYGVPMYHDGRRYYYNGANNRRIYVNNSNNKYINQWNHQSNWKNSSRVVSQPPQPPVVNQHHHVDNHMQYPSHFPSGHSSPHFSNPSRTVNMSRSNNQHMIHQPSQHSFSGASHQIQRSPHTSNNFSSARSSAGSSRGNRRR